MKKTILVLALMAGIINGAVAHNAAKEVPDQVVKSFSSRYAHTHGPKWESRNDTFIAKFTMSKRKRHAYYLADGSWIKTETKLPWSWNLPKAVENTWGHSVFASWYIDEIKQIESPQENLYVIQVHHNYGPDGAIPGDNDNVYKLYYNADGTFLRKEHKE